MACFTKTVLSVRLISRNLRQDSLSRGLRTSTRCRAAQNFTMPALSPTMTEGNIASWKLKEGDSFSAGDVLLEIETDKASMDVEAQDDGVMARITQGDGSKGIKVGTRIAVIAETGDDIQNLEIAPDGDAAQPSPRTEAQQLDPETTSESQAEAPPTSKPSAPATAAERKTTDRSRKQISPLLPSVAHLVHQHSLDQSVVENITPSGPNGRLLKGDVLAYLGNIKDTYPSELASKIAALSHLDLNNIEIASRAAPPKVSREAESELPAPKFTDIAVPIDMQNVIKIQQRLRRVLNTHLPVSTFIERATEMANDRLPRPKSRKSSSSELFDELLGLNIKTPMTVRGTLRPQLSTRSLPPPQHTTPTKGPDIIDYLISKQAPAGAPQPRGERSAIDTLSVVVPQGDEQHGQVFLERMKMVLEEDPGRLVL